MAKDSKEQLRTRPETDALLALIGLKATAIASETEENPSTVLKEINGQRSNLKVKTKIAQVVAKRAAEFMMRPVL